MEESTFLWRRRATLTRYDMGQSGRRALSVSYVRTCCTTTTIEFLNSVIRHGPVHDLSNFRCLQRIKGRGQ